MFPISKIFSKPRILFFFRRIGARLIDLLVLTLIGIGLTSIPRLSPLGDWGLLLGFAIVLLYEGVFHSSLGKGKSLGKLFFGLTVTNFSGSYLSFTDALVRGIPFAIALVVLETKVVLSTIYPSFQFSFTILSLTLFIIFGFISPLLILIRTPQQSFADLLVNSIVTTQKTAIQSEFSGSSHPLFSANYRKYQFFILCSFLVYSVLILFISAFLLKQKKDLAEILKRSNAIVQSHHLPLGKIYLSPEQTTENKSILVSRIKANPELLSESGKQIGELTAFTLWTELMTQIPEIFTTHIGSIQFKYGLNLGFSDGTVSYQFSYQ